ncbi:MAG: FG-GAP-like repeat-containing protein [Myxococcaceae bacterium]|nr:FG-GAP-like repeat-containing protein [Myxococcaceae bacterium]
MHRRAFLVLLAISAGCGERLRQVDPDNARCGDGVVTKSKGEVCDGSDLGGQSCLSLGFDTGTLICGSDCQLVTTQCTRRCGNGVVESGETCDGDAGLSPCATFGYRACGKTCAVEETHCVGAWFVPGPEATVMKGGASVVLDLPPSGLGDLVCAVQSFARLEVYPYDLDRGFPSSKKLSFGKAPVALAPIDLDGDGQAEVLALADDGSLDRYVPSGTAFSLAPLADAGCVGQRLVGTGVGFDGGAMAVAGCGNDAGVFLVERRSGPSVIPVAPGSQLAVGDLDGDGVTDVLAVAPGAIEAIPYRGPQLAAGAALPTGQPLGAFALGDLDGDGDADLLVPGAAAIALYENTGQGFAAKGELPATQAAQLLVRDLDLDGRVDLAFVAKGQLELRRQSGPFTFTSVSFPVPAGTPLSVSAGDLDGDGDLDLAVTVQSATGDANTATFLGKVR